MDASPAAIDADDESKRHDPTDADDDNERHDPTDANDESEQEAPQARAPPARKR